MKPLYHILYFLILATLTACQTDDGINGQDNNGQITIKFTAEPQTRTTLVSSDNVQHVKYVQVYVFEGTEPDAPCVASENAGWKQLQPGGTATQYYTLKHKLTNGQTYTIIAAGLDTDNDEQEGAGYAYGLPDAIKVKTETEEGTALGNAKATLATAEASDMTTAELFAGSNAITVEPGTNRITEIALKRRVAGVMIYLTNIDPSVKRITVKTYQKPNTSIALIAAPENDYGLTPTTEEEADILLDVEITDEMLKAEVIKDKNNTVIGTKLPGTILAGAYLIPMAAPGSGNTLTLTQYTWNGTTGYTPYKEHPLKLKNPTGTDVTSYPLEANSFYTIGTKNAQTDEPYDIGGTVDGDCIYVDGNWQADVNIPM